MSIVHFNMSIIKSFLIIILEWVVKTKATKQQKKYFRKN